MSLLESLKDRLKPAKPLAPQLFDALKEAEAELARLQSQRGTYALALAQGEPDAEASMSAWRRKVADQEQVVDDLRAAKKAAVEKDQQAEIARIAAVRQSQIASVKHMLGDQAKAIARLGAACENINNAWNDVIELAVEIHQALDQAGMSPTDLAPWCGLVRPDRLRALVSIELWRTNKTKQTNDGAYRWGFFGVNEADRFRRQLAVEGMHDLTQETIHDPPFEMKNVKSLTARLAEQREELLRICQAQPLPTPGVVVEPPRTQPPNIAQLKVPPPQFIRGPDGIERYPDGSLPLNQDSVPPPIPMDVVLPQDEADAEMVRRIEAATARAREAKAEKRRAFVEANPDRARELGIAP